MFARQYCRRKVHWNPTMLNVCQTILQKKSPLKSNNVECLPDNTAEEKSTEIQHWKGGRGGKQKHGKMWQPSQQNWLRLYVNDRTSFLHYIIRSIHGTVFISHVANVLLMFFLQLESGSANRDFAKCKKCMMVRCLIAWQETCVTFPDKISAGNCI